MDDQAFRGARTTSSYRTSSHASYCVWSALPFQWKSAQCSYVTDRSQVLSASTLSVTVATGASFITQADSGSRLSLTIARATLTRAAHDPRANDWSLEPK